MAEKKTRHMVGNKQNKGRHDKEESSMYSCRHLAQRGSLEKQFKERGNMLEKQFKELGEAIQRTR
jgi:hypothetical protein